MTLHNNNTKTLINSEEKGTTTNAIHETMKKKEEGLNY